MNTTKALSLLALLAICGLCAAQNFPGLPSIPAPPGVPTPPPLPALPSTPALPGGLVGPFTAPQDAIDLLKMLHDRKDTLKDFTGKIDYNVEDPRGDATGKTGKVSYLQDPVKGPIFSADFDKKTNDRKPTGIYYVQFIFDGREFTIKDLGLDGKGRSYVRSIVLPPGAKPGDAVTLNGALPLPIGLDVNDVLQNFEVAKVIAKDAKDPNLAALTLVPRDHKKFAYQQLVVTVDRKLQLPVTLAETAMDDTVTTMTLTDLQINTGQAKMLDPGTPAADGWTPKAAGAPAAP